MTRTRFLAVVAAMLVATWALPLAAADKPKPKTDPADPVEKPAAKGEAPAKGDDAAEDTIEVLHPNDASAFKANIGKEVAVEGRVSESSWSASGKVMQVKFAEAKDTQFMAAVFIKSRAALDKAFGGDMSQAISGKRVRVIGTVTEYKGKPEIVIEKASQLEILADGAGAAAGDSTKPVEKPKPAEPAKPAAGAKPKQPAK